MSSKEEKDHLIKPTRSFIDLPRAKSPYDPEVRKRPTISSRLSLQEFESKKREEKTMNRNWRELSPTDGVFGFHFNK